jgi:broad specificity phosphatase PhoE
VAGLPVHASIGIPTLQVACPDITDGPARAAVPAPCRVPRRGGAFAARVVSMLVALAHHGHVASVGTLAGRMPGPDLTAQGRAEAGRLAAALAAWPVAAIYSSPLARARQTAAAIASAQGLDVTIEPALTDVDFGAWNGASLAALAHVPAWTRFNADREAACAPGGEPLAAVRTRALRALRALRRAHRTRLVVAVTHEDVIRSAVAGLAGCTLDAAHALRFGTGRLTLVEWGDEVPRLLALDQPPDVLRPEPPPEDDLAWALPEPHP